MSFITLVRILPSCWFHGVVSKDALRHMLCFSSYWSGLLLAKDGRLSWVKCLHLSLFLYIVIFAVCFLKVCLILGKVEPTGGIKYRPATAIVSTRISAGASTLPFSHWVPGLCLCRYLKADCLAVQNRTVSMITSVSTFLFKPFERVLTLKRDLSWLSSGWGGGEAVKRKKSLPPTHTRKKKKKILPTFEQWLPLVAMI